MRFDRRTLVLLNLLAVTVLLPFNPVVPNAVAVLFLIRITLNMREGVLPNGRQVATADNSSLPTPSYLRARTY
jgi:hypothetical protein